MPIVKNSARNKNIMTLKNKVEWDSLYPWMKPHNLWEVSLTLVMTKLSPIHLL
jgi:hypothetical protein